MTFKLVPRNRIALSISFINNRDNNINYCKIGGWTGRGSGAKRNGGDRPIVQALY
jgi:hypothetical protein